MLAVYPPSLRAHPFLEVSKLDSIDTELSNYDAAVVFSADDVTPDLGPVAVVLDADEIAFELGVWISGLLNFPRTCVEAFRDRGDSSSEDRSRELRISLLGLQRCAAVSLDLRKVVGEGGYEGIGRSLSLSIRDMEQLSEQLRNLILLNRSVSGTPKPAEWHAWSLTLEQQLGSSSAAARLASHVRLAGKSALPKELADLFARPETPFGDRSDIDEIASRIGVTLRSLELVDRMLRGRQPLKQSLIIFAAVHEQTRELLGFINNRLARFPDEQALFFTLLDSASYGTSLELRKVFQQELRGIVQLIPPPSVQARVEAANELMLDSFQQMLVELARAIQPDAAPHNFFPRYVTKLERSLELRRDLWELLRKVQGTEGDPGKQRVDDLRATLRTFSEATARELHFKDRETLERFNEEVHAAREKKDLVPILHRFGAYLETLFGQVSMRAVLAAHPFDRTD